MSFFTIFMDGCVEYFYNLALKEGPNAVSRAYAEELNAALESAKKAITDVHRKGLRFAVNEGHEFYKQGFNDAIKLFFSEGGDTHG